MSDRGRSLPRLGYEQIVQRFRADIALGRLRAGERLPPMRTLAAELHVNVNTVARAYAELARDGTIDAQPGGGSFVRAGADDATIADRRSDQLRGIVGDAVLRGLSLGFTAAQIEAAVQTQLGRWQAANELSDLTEEPAQADVLTFAGSHDLALEVLAARLRQRQPPIDTDLRFTGSMAGLMALLLGETQVAGCHLGGADSDGGIEGDGLVERLLPGQKMLVVTLARRQQGLIVPPGNPRQLESIRDLVAPDLKIALRQPGAGTRLLLERELQRTGVDLKLEDHPVLSTHSAVAAAVAEGSADVGVGILAAARTYGLGFVPLAWERYELVIPARLASVTPVATLLDVLGTSELAGVIEALGGYDTALTGERRLIG